MDAWIHARAHTCLAMPVLTHTCYPHVCTCVCVCVYIYIYIDIEIYIYICMHRNKSLNNPNLIHTEYASRQYRTKARATARRHEDKGRVS